MKLLRHQPLQQRRLSHSAWPQQQQGSDRVARVGAFVEFTTELRDGGVRVWLLQQVHGPLEVSQDGGGVKVGGVHKVSLESLHFVGNVWGGGEGLEDDAPAVCAKATPVPVLTCTTVNRCAR